MTDYAEEQRNEIEALMSIYSEELEIVQDSPQYVFQLKVTSSESQEVIDPEDPNSGDDRVACAIQFTYTPTYPDEAPLMEIISSEKLDDEQQTTVLDFINDQLDDEQQTTVLDFINDQVQENLGMVMVFTIVSALQEKLTVMVEDAKRLAEERRIQKEKEEEEAERKKFEGTRVTIESFLAWKAKFDAERRECKRLQGELDQTSKKLSGKELFMTDATLNDSDVNFLQDEGESVEVDESLFEDMEDLDIDEDEEDDPDWEPDKK